LRNLDARRELNLPIILGAIAIVVERREVVCSECSSVGIVAACVRLLQIARFVAEDNKEREGA